MDGLLTFRGRLPGVLVETALPARRESPLRLDVAGFVGFAERGPVNTPVAVEDYSGFRHVFGGDLPLAVENGTPVYAHLPSAVRAFFDNGGRRCYVVRVVGEGARANRLPIAGLAVIGAAGEIESGEFAQGMAAAAWMGRWSDGMSVRSQLRILPLRIAAADSYHYDAVSKAATLRLELPAATTVRDGDVVRLSFGDAAGTQVLLLVAGVSVTGAYSVRGFPVTLALENVTDKAAFGTNVAVPAEAPSEVACLRASGWEEVAGPYHPMVNKVGDDAGYHLFLPQEDQVEPGALLRVRYTAGEDFYFPVASVRLHYAPAADDVDAVAALLEQDDPLLPEGVYRRAVTDELASQAVAGEEIAGTLEKVERLRFDLAIYEGERALDLLQDLSFNPTATYWAEYRAAQATETLASGGALGAGDAGVAGSGKPESPARRAGVVSDFWVDRLARVKDDMRAVELGAFAGRSLHLRALDVRAPRDGQAGTIWLPLAMRGLPTAAGVLAEAAGLEADSGKDGLDVFDPEALFLDERLKESTLYGLMKEAEYILYLQQPPGTLKKLHSLTGMEEVGLIAIPDLAQRAWNKALAPPPPPEPEPEPVPEPDWSRFRRCRLPEGTSEPPYNPADAPCSDAPPVHMPGQAQAAERDPCQQLGGLPEAEPPAAYQLEPLLAVQRALIRLCAARADALAVLTVPLHFGRSEVVDWQEQLVNTPALLSGPALSYAAAYHGWTLRREEACPALAPVRAVPPEGAVCGMIAGRERERGAWIAPANTPLVGVIGLAPAFGDGDWEELYNRQVNILRPQPGRFAAMSAFTLSADRQLVQISVRRLLIFLRKAALRRGQQFVFEINNERFRQQVQVSFERLMAALVERGALAAFQVVTSEEVNTPNDGYNGRFIVALKVAPTLPIEFITVVMLRSGESLLEILER